MKEGNKEVGEIDISKTIESNINYWRNKCLEQQKELEQEKEKNKELFLQYEKEVDKLEYQITTMISKDKIREIFDNYSQSSLMENNTFLEFKKELLEERN